MFWVCLCEMEAVLDCLVRLCVSVCCMLCEFVHPVGIAPVSRWWRERTSRGVAWRYVRCLNGTYIHHTYMCCTLQDPYVFKWVGWYEGLRRGCTVCTVLYVYSNTAAATTTTRARIQTQAQNRHVPCFAFLALLGRLFALPIAYLTCLNSPLCDRVDLAIA